MRPFWQATADLGLYVFIHPLPRVIGWSAMNADDLGRMLGWEFSLMVAAVRLINSGLLDELPILRVQFSHFAGGIGRYRTRIEGFQQRDRAGTVGIHRHDRQPLQHFDHYVRHRLFYDCAGWSSRDRAAEYGGEWTRIGLAEVPASQCVFATDYPQVTHADEEIAAYIAALRALGPDAQDVLDGANAAKLIPDLSRRSVAGSVTAA